MTIVLDGTSGITSPNETTGVLTATSINASGAITAASVTTTGATGSLNSINTFGFKNRIINGNMAIDQRNAGASVTPTSSGAYIVDRWQAIISLASKFSVQQNTGAVTPPSGFSNYLGATSLSVYSLGVSDYFALNQRIEGFNIADLGFGTANASTVTLSFWVRSSLTGTFGGSLGNSAGTRSYPFSYSIPVANTWTQIAITIAGDTTGTWLTNNGIGVGIAFGLGSGSTYSGTAGSWATGNYVQPTGTVSIVGTSGATFYITGVQLEKGSVATSFDYRPYGTELSLCQRYYEKSYDVDTVPATATFAGVMRFPYGAASSIVYANLNFTVPKRTSPTVNTWDQAGNSGRMSFYSGAAGVLTNNLNALASNWGGVSNWGFSANTSTAGAAGTYTVQWTATAEL